MEDACKPRRVRRIWALLVVFGALALIVAALVSAFRFGAGSAIASAAGVLVGYKGAAMAFDWRGALDEIADALAAGWGWVTSLFDW